MAPRHRSGGLTPTVHTHSILQLISRNAVLVRDNVKGLPRPKHRQGVFEPGTAADEHRLPDPAQGVGHKFGPLISGEPDQTRVAVVREVDAPEVSTYDVVEDT